MDGDSGLTMFLYNGKYGVASDDNGLYYMRARYYDISIKRFVNQDVVIGHLDATSSLNRYAYCEGNPVSYLDPFGLERKDVNVKDILDWIGVASKLIGIGVVVLNPASAVTVMKIWTFIDKVLSAGNIVADINEIAIGISNKDKEKIALGITDLLSDLAQELLGLIVHVDVGYYRTKDIFEIDDKANAIERAVETAVSAIGNYIKEMVYSSI